MQKIKYSTEKYHFRETISDLFDCENLEKIHVKRSDLMPKQELDHNNESSTEYHKKFYDFIRNNEDFKKNYNNFIKNEIEGLFDEEIIFQRLPGFRIHLKNSKAINKWHSDGDADHRHPKGEINFMLAITECLDNNTTWVESTPGKNDFSPLNMNYGEFYMFNGNECMHGNKFNDSEKTRISFDFRIIPLSKYNENNSSSNTTNQKFAVGEYYDKF